MNHKSESVRFRKDAINVLWCMRNIQGSAALITLEEYLNGASLQRERIKDDKAKLLTHSGPGVDLSSNLVLFMDIHFYVTCLDRFTNLLRRIVKNEQDAAMDSLWHKYGGKLAYTRTARNHLEHIEERIYDPQHRYLADLGNLKGDCYTFGGYPFDISEKSLTVINEAYNDLIAILSTRPVRAPP